MRRIVMSALVLATWTLMAESGTINAFGLTPARQEAIVARHKAVFTAPPKNTPSNSAVDAPLLGNGDTLVAFAGGPAKLQFYINKNDLWIMNRERRSHPAPLARLDLDLPDLQGASYKVEQDLLRAVTTGNFAKDGKTLTVETAVAATENLLWATLSAEGGAITGRATLFLPAQDVAETTAAKPEDAAGVQAVERRFEEGVMTPAGAACAMRVLGGNGEFTVTPGKPVIIIAAVCSRFDREDFRAAAVNRAAAFTGKDLLAVAASHESWWRDFWGKSFVEIPDKVLEQRYYLSHYVMASASRVLDFPPGLVGWVTTEIPSWYGDYHLNYNHVAPFYGLYAANHIEQADPCHGPILDAIGMGHDWSLTHCGIKDGILLPVGIGPKGSIAFAVLLDQKSNSAYSCVPLAFRWYATYDPDFARRAYPFIRDTARFWEKWLKLEPASPAEEKPSDGLCRPGNARYVIYKDAIEERSGEDVNSILSIGLVKQVMNLAIDMSTELGVDDDRRAKWADIRYRLSEYPACTVRDLPAQFWPKHMPQTDETLNLQIFRYTEKGMPWCEANTMGIQHIYPAGGVGLDSKPELLRRARNQVRVMHRWIDVNGMNSFYAAAARVGYDPTVILKEMRFMLGQLALPNGMIDGNPHGMEHQSIVPNAIQEMLLQSHEGVIRFFPCWPKEQNARFGTLRARGAFLVSAELKSGEVKYVKIHSEKGRDCTLVNPWPGKAIHVYRDGKKIETLNGERVVLKTGAGMTVILGPESVGFDALRGRIGVTGDSQRKMSPATPAGTTYYVDSLAGMIQPTGERRRHGARWNGSIARYSPLAMSSCSRRAAAGRASCGLRAPAAKAVRSVSIATARGHCQLLTWGQPPARRSSCRTRSTGRSAIWRSPAARPRLGITARHLVLGSGTGRVFRHIVVGDCHRLDTYSQPYSTWFPGVRWKLDR